MEKMYPAQGVSVLLRRPSECVALAEVLWQEDSSSSFGESNSEIELYCKVLIVSCCCTEAVVPSVAQQGRLYILKFHHVHMIFVF